VDARKFLPHLRAESYPAGALAAAIFLCSGVRSMERGTISMERGPDGRDVPADLELARLAVPRRVYTVSHMEYVADRLAWLQTKRDLVGGLAFVDEPPVLRFFFGRLRPDGDWPERLTEEFRREFGDEV
jgi:tryptophanase